MCARTRAAECRTNAEVLAGEKVDDLRQRERADDDEREAAELNRVRARSTRMSRCGCVCV